MKTKSGVSCEFPGVLCVISLEFFGKCSRCNSALQVYAYGGLGSIFYELDLQNNLPPLNFKRWFIRETKVFIQYL